MHNAFNNFFSASGETKLISLTCFIRSFDIIQWIIYL